MRFVRITNATREYMYIIDYIIIKTFRDLFTINEKQSICECVCLADKISQDLRQVDVYVYICGIRKGWKRRPETGVPSR